MARYKLDLNQIVYFTLIIEADDELEAKRKAYKQGFTLRNITRRGGMGYNNTTLIESPQPTRAGGE